MIPSQGYNADYSEEKEEASSGHSLRKVQPVIVKKQENIWHLRYSSEAQCRQWELITKNGHSTVHANYVVNTEYNCTIKAYLHVMEISSRVRVYFK